VHYEDAPEGGARFIVRIPVVETARPAHANDDAQDHEKKPAHSAPVDL